MTNVIKAILQSNISMHQNVLSDETLLANIKQAAECAIVALKKGNKLLVCGNGGSAADAQHMAAEFVGRFQRERKGLAAIALNTDTSIITAWANDYDYNSVFTRQVEALGREGDVLLGISTSGNSANVLQAFQYAEQQGIKTIGLLGSNGGTIKNCSDIAIVVPERCTARVQEAHITIIHIICQLVEEVIYHEK